jgi:quinol monooxygenase YgiN
MNDEICSIYHLTIDPVNLPAFYALTAKLVAGTSKELDTVGYEFSINADRTEIHIIERYRTSGLLPHVEQTFAPFAQEFLSLVKIDKLYVYGNTTAAIRAKLDGFGAIYLTPYDGFKR